VFIAERLRPPPGVPARLSRCGVGRELLLSREVLYPPHSRHKVRAQQFPVSRGRLPPAIDGVPSAVPTGSLGRSPCEPLNGRVTAFSHTVRMSERYPLALRQVDQARTDFATIESDLQFLMAQLARIPTRKEQARNALGIIFATAMLTTLAVLWFTGYWRYCL
jgi:hypothetical protein